MPKDDAISALSKLKNRIKATRGRAKSEDLFYAYNYVMTVIDEEIAELKKKAAKEPPSS